MFKSLNNYPSKNLFVIVSGLIGNMMESFDLMLCFFMSQILANSFTPPTSSANNLFYIFYTFLLGYLSKPVGSVIISLYADQLGRKRMLVFSIILAGFGTAMIACIPSYGYIGIFSYILFLIFRIMQNTSLGGEYISSIAYLIEHGEEKKRGFFGCWVALGLNTGTLIASVVSFATIYLIDKEIIPSWSWRIIFLMALIGMLIGTWMRLCIPESIGFILENSSTKIIRKSDILKNSIKFINSYKGQCIGIFFISWLGVCATLSIYVYSPIHLTMTHHFTQYESLGINSISLVLLIAFIPVFGFLSDYINRINLLILSSMCFIVLSFPYFWYLSYGTYTEIILIKLILSLICACYFSIAPTVITEIFPLKIRCTSVSLIYQTASSLAGGLTPIIMLYLANKTNTPHSPFYLLMISSILGVTALIYLRNNPIITSNEIIKETSYGHQASYQNGQ